MKWFAAERASVCCLCVYFRLSLPTTKTTLRPVSLSLTHKAATLIFGVLLFSLFAFLLLHVTVHHLLRQHHRLRAYAMWTPDLLSQMCHQHEQLPCLQHFLPIHKDIQAVNPRIAKQMKKLKGNRLCMKRQCHDSTSQATQRSTSPCRRRERERERERRPKVANRWGTSQHTFETPGGTK